MTQKDEFNRREKNRYSEPILSREGILELFSKQKDALTFKNILQRASLSKSSLTEALKKRLNAMVRDGQLIFDNTSHYRLSSNLDLVKGVVSINKNNMGVLISDHPIYNKLYLKDYDLLNIISGDELLVRVLPAKIESINTCTIVDIVKRGITEFLGLVYRKGGYVFVSPNCNAIKKRPVLIKGGFDALDGELVRVKIVGYPAYKRQFSGKIIERLGLPFDQCSEITMAIDKHKLRNKWPEQVLAELGDVLSYVDDDSIEGRKDWRSMPFVTIDGEDAKDYDDAVYVESLDGGGWCVRVAIADVAHYVKPGTAIDKEAQLRATSVYFPGYVIPMLPEKLSNGLCSLKAHKNRLALGVEVILDDKGNIENYKVFEVVVKISSRMTYLAISDYLTGNQPTPEWFVVPLKSLDLCFKALLKVRNQRGAMDFNIKESQLIFDKKGMISGFKPVVRLISHRIIEELMLLSNHCIANWIKLKKQSTLYRVHGVPDESRLDVVSAYFKHLGVEFPKHVKKTKDYFDCLLSLRKSHDAGVGEMMMLRAMPQAYYASDGETGHFGLGYKDYLHFTSPIRRYPDLIVHRLLKAMINNVKPENINLNWLGTHCSFQERVAEGASRDVLSWMKCRWLDSHIGDSFNAVISTVVNFGMFVSLDEVVIDGMVHVSTLGREYFQFDAVKSELVGSTSGKHFSVGQKILVKVIKVDVINQYVDCAIIQR